MQLNSIADFIASLIWPLLRIAVYLGITLAISAGVTLLLELHCSLALEAWKRYSSITMMKWGLDLLSSRQGPVTTPDIGASITHLVANTTLPHHTHNPTTQAQDNVWRRIAQTMGPTLLHEGVQFAANMAMR